ncbi:hypothetical protein PR202_ga04239 [Eleusine coracana subsp. coracana]|uniref:Phosphatidate cytidylyltransferase n=1 Tax=Eleusine coracana subsp. coracana TaxID=191504 RepID=A0AAV5BPU3_ELECO|nr:hypothetical protein PR202_ga04239 [Eleusine coracana subsp. coracana]
MHSITMWTDSPLLWDIGAALLTAVAAAAVLRFWEVVANLLDQKLCRKLVHITVGLVYFLMWPLFSSDDIYAPFLAPLIIILNIVKVTLIGLGVVKDEGVVNSMTRNGDHRLLSGVADIVGRRLGHAKLPHNPEKSYVGTVGMFLAGFLASVLHMCYFHRFGFVEKSWAMVVAFGVISLVAAVVESLPISTRLDDNLTVPLASVLVGSLVFYSIGVRSLCCMSSGLNSISPIAEMVFAGSSK